ncbi:hypothetical protein BA79_17322 [Bacillus altitudinis 41KF2b]|nr:hypothetical protein BA79_17322 [Bacillus altitudinis 41KF2b]
MIVSPSLFMKSGGFLSRYFLQKDILIYLLSAFLCIYPCTETQIHSRIYNGETKKANVSYFF